MTTADKLRELETALLEERFASARAELATIGDIEALPPLERARAELLRLRCAVRSHEPLDRVVLDARRALGWAPPGMPRALLLAEIAYALTAKHCTGLARKVAFEVDHAEPSSSLGPHLLGWNELQSDDRAAARAAYEEATRRRESWRGHLGLARVAYVEGDFERSLVELSRVEELRETRLPVLRFRANIARVKGDWAGFLDLNERISIATAGGEYDRHDRLDRASALFALGRNEEGLAIYRALWRDDPSDWAGRFAREVLNAVERGGNCRARVMLASFPTVTQKRNYCGPATLELVLRHLGIEANQDTIAPVVKGEYGSPIQGMTRYLESHCLETRRFEADGARLRVCLELGLPVIVEEEHSTTAHVAVVIGVDEQLGLLLVQDPMTHVTNERLIETQGHLGALYRNASIVAFPREDREVAAKLDLGGVRDLPHLRLVDASGARELADQPEEVLRLCDRAIALCEDYPLAWQRRTYTLFAQMERAHTPNNAARFLVALREARVRYGRQEWPHQIHGHYLDGERRFEEALIEYEEALRLDPDDSNNAQNIAECHKFLGRSREATAAFWKALAIDPSHVRATENLAAHSLDEGDLDAAEHLAECALEMAPKNPFNRVTASRVAKARGDREGALSQARKAIELELSYHHGRLHLAQLLRGSPSAEERAEALTIYEQMAADSPQWFEPRWRAAHLLQSLGRIEDACALLIAGIEIAEDDPVDLVRTLTEVLLEDGQDDRAVELAERFARERPTVDLRGLLWEVLAHAEREARGTELVSEFLAESPSSPYACAEYASWLIGGDDESKAEALLKKAIDGAPTYAYARRSLGTLLSNDRREEAVRVLSQAPSMTVPLFVEMARVENERGRFAEARAALDAARAIDPHVTWGHQAEWNHSWLADPPEEVLARLIAQDDSSLLALRARFCLATALGETREALVVLDRIPIDDSTMRDILPGAADGNDAFRPALDARFRAYEEEPDTDHAARRYAHAVRVGNLAALGDREGLDRFLATERNVTRQKNVLETLHVVRQRELVLAVRSTIAQNEPASARVIVERIALASMRGDHRRAVSIARECLATWPRNRQGTRLLAGELLLLGRFDEALLYSRRAARMPGNWVHEDEMAAAAALACGHREEASERVERARRRRLSCGYSIAEHVLLCGVTAALAHDRARVLSHREVAALHFAPESPFWARLLAVADE